jgi:ankyrin repeat protein
MDLCTTCTDAFNTSKDWRTANMAMDKSRCVGCCIRNYGDLKLDAIAAIPKNKYDIGKPNKYGRTLLQDACTARMTRLALALLETGRACPEHVDPSGRTALMDACEKDEDFALILLATGKSNPGQINNDGYTALMYACSNYKKELALAILATGESHPWQIGCKWGLTNSALSACCSNYVDMTDVALAIIAINPSKAIFVDSFGMNPLMRALENRRPKIAMAILDNYECRETHNLVWVDRNGMSPLLFACRLEYEDIAMRLLSYEPSMAGVADQHKSWGYTPLMWACSNKQPRLAMELLRTGKSQPGLADAAGSTALCRARENGLFEVADVLHILGCE